MKLTNDTTGKLKKIKKILSVLNIDDNIYELIYDEFEQYIELHIIWKHNPSEEDLSVLHNIWKCLGGNFVSHKIALLETVNKYDWEGNKVYL